MMDTLSPDESGIEAQPARLPTPDSVIRTTSVPENTRATRARACTQCHRQKQRCNKEQPCSNCVRRGIPSLCVWPSQQKKRARNYQIYEHAHNPAPLLSTQSQGIPSNYDESLQSRSATSSAPRQQLGKLFKARGAPSYHGDSYFGHHSAALIMDTFTPELPTGIDVGHSRRTRVGATQPFRSERGPYAQLWELVGSLPRRKAIVDHLTQRFFQELNPTFDAVHEETFRAQYDRFWDRKAGCDDLTNMDIRWLAVLFMVLAFGELLDCPQPCSVEAQRECEDSSLHFYWAGRKSLVIAPSFYGESPDLVRAGILITKYLVYARRISESWLTGSFAVRMAQAQGMHIDGEQLGLPRKVTETRRRLWSQLYNLDRSIALALGRPNSINEMHCVVKEAGNVWVDDLSNEDAEIAQPYPLETQPTRTALIIFQHRLSVIIGKIQDLCFSVSSASGSSTSYDEVLKHDEELEAWRASLPSYFRLDSPDISLDTVIPFIFWHRHYLHTGYHFTRITLHRAYLLRPSITDRFQYSRNACISSACADLKIKLSFRNLSMADRIKANTAAHQLFNSALILGVLAVRDPHSLQTEAILDDLQAYCDKQNADTWANEFGLAEVRVVELCIARTRQTRREAASGSQQYTPTPTASFAEEQTVMTDTPSAFTERMLAQEGLPGTEDQYMFQNQLGPGEGWSDLWSAYYFPEPMNYQQWEGLVEDLAMGR